MIPEWKIYPRSQGHSTVYLKNVVHSDSIEVGKSEIFGRGDVRAIVKMLSDLTPDRLCETAKANFERAKDFDREKLTERRRSFYGEFAKEARDVGA